VALPITAGTPLRSSLGGPLSSHRSLSIPRAENAAPTGAAAIRLRGVIKLFGSVVAVDGLDLDVPAAERACG
jgi:hypothetical protein